VVVPTCSAAVEKNKKKTNSSSESRKKNSNEMMASASSPSTTTTTTTTTTTPDGATGATAPSGPTDAAGATGNSTPDLDLGLSPEARATVALLRSLGTSDVVHTGGESFLSHLIGVYRVLKSWGAPEYLCLAGLAHSIYSTEGFQGFSLDCSPQNRAEVAGVLGSLEAEKIAHVFCCTDRASQDEDLFSSEAGGGWEEEGQHQHRWRVRKGAPLATAPVAAAPSSSSLSSSPHQLFAPGTAPEDPYPGGFISLTHREWLDYTTLTLADWMEQVEAAALKESKHFR